MNDPKPSELSNPSLERRLLDVLIRAGLILALVMLCYRVLSPFLVLMVWALILAITCIRCTSGWPAGWAGARAGRRR